MGCTIYGQEQVEFILDITDVNSAVVQDTSNWNIRDSDMSGSDTSTAESDKPASFRPSHSFKSSGQKNISAVTDFDDGWGNIYEHDTELVVNPIEYLSPELDFNWSPLNPTIRDMIEFAQDHNDTRDATNYYGRIDEVRVDYFDDGYDIIDSDGDGTATDEFISDTSGFFKNINTLVPNVPVRLKATYWNGWEPKETDILKIIAMENIPPVADYSKTESGICVPSYVWSAQSTDADSDVANLNHSWKMFYLENSLWTFLGDGTGGDFSYPFQFEGEYKIELTSTDASGGEGKKEEEFVIIFDECGAKQDPCPDCPDCPDNEDCPDCPDCPELSQGESVDCRDCIAAALARYKAAHGLDDGKNVIVVPSVKVVGVSASEISSELHGRVSSQRATGQISGDLSGRVSSGSMGGKVGGSIKGSIKKG